VSKTDIDNPMYNALFNLTEATTNVPLARLYSKVNNVRESMNSDHETWKRVALLLGWSTWNFGIKNQDVISARQEIKEIKAEERKAKNEAKKQEKKIEKQKEEEALVQENIEKQKKQKEEGKKVLCAAINKSGNQCGKEALPGKSFCTVHEKKEQRADGKKTQCTQMKSDGKRCKMQTSNKSGKCYYHD
jgi:hypothetical protein